MKLKDRNRKKKN